MPKRRVTISADSEAVAAGQQAVLLGEYGSLSEWSNAAMAEKGARDLRMRHLREALAAYEDEYGVITDDEIAARAQADRDSAIVVRERHQPGTGAA